jgi:hypothetical protein
MCRKMTAIQYPDNGCLGGPHQVAFSFNDNTSNVNISISVEQNLVRKVELISNKAIKCKELFSIFQSLEKLLMLFDGKFYPIKELDFSNETYDDSEQFSDISKGILDDRLSYFTSKDFCQNSFMKLIPYQDILSAELFSKWRLLLEQMDVSYSVFLCSLSDNKNMVDMNLAFLIEFTEPLVELIKENTFFCQTLSPGGRGTTLEMCVDALITHYGTDVFEKELNENYKDFLRNVVNSRVRIMHIKRNFEKSYFGGKDCVRYSMKFSILYRKILFDLLNIPQETYEYSLKEAVQRIDEW